MEPAQFVELKLGEEKFIVQLPLTIGQLRNYQPEMVKFKGLATVESYDALFNAFLAVIDKEKYPYMCRSYLEKLRMTPEQLLDESDKIGYGSGVFKKSEPKEGGSDTGEVKAP